MFQPLLKRATIVAIGMSVMASVSAADLARADKKFLEAAAQAGHTEVEGSKLAQGKAASADVKSFADQMIQDHTKVGDELNTLASSKGVKVPTEPSVGQKAKLKMLGSYSGANFDKHYAKQIGVAAHEDTVKLFRKASKDVKDADVKAFADKTLPSLEHHLEMARALDKKTPDAK